MHSQWSSRFNRDAFSEALAHTPSKLLPMPEGMRFTRRMFSLISQLQTVMAITDGYGNSHESMNHTKRNLHPEPLDRASHASSWPIDGDRPGEKQTLANPLSFPQWTYVYCNCPEALVEVDINLGDILALRSMD